MYNPNFDIYLISKSLE